MSLERHFDTPFTAGLARREKQVQQSYRPVIGIHKWFARRPGTVFRNLLLAEFAPQTSPEDRFFTSHELRGVVADPFLGGGTTAYEATRLGFSVVGADVNPMATWIVRQALEPLDLDEFAAQAAKVAHDVEREIGDLYVTRCNDCGDNARAKYFLWVKTARCPDCGHDNDLFHGHLLAKAVRHPRHVVVCAGCGDLGEYETLPTKKAPGACGACGESVRVEGPTRKGKTTCRGCGSVFAFLPAKTPLRQRMWALEYHCTACKPGRKGRFFKRPDADDLARFDLARRQLRERETDLDVPDDPIPPGDETARLHRRGHHRFRDLFGPRQLLGLGLLLRRIRAVESPAVRHALLTVFSDSLRYQNLLCRYDTYALKCQDVFSVHGFPVGLQPCENNLLGIPRVGSGSFRHFVEKYLRAKRYCDAPFEARGSGPRNRVEIPGERIAATLVDRFPEPRGREAWIVTGPAETAELPEASLDGVFTDPPYFDNVQYAELMDFCFAWLRIGLAAEFPSFRRPGTRHPSELTGNRTAGRGIEDFAGGMSRVFSHYARALKPGAPFVFTYHHNDPRAYAPLVVAILDAGLCCTAVLATPGEMAASLHIAGTGSSTVDSVFVCRATTPLAESVHWTDRLEQDVRDLAAAGLAATEGDVRCLTAGHLARAAVNALHPTWDRAADLPERMRRATAALHEARATRPAASRPLAKDASASHPVGPTQSPAT